MSKDKIKITDEVEFVFEMAKRAWSLSPAELESIRPGEHGVSDMLAMLNVPPTADQPLKPKTFLERENPHIHLLKIMRDPNFFPFTCRALFGRPDGGGQLNILPFQNLILQELWNRQFPLLCMSRGGGKSFLLGLYALLRATFTPGSKVVITGSAFRQSKQVFEYIERIWFNSPVFRTLVNAGKSKHSGRHNGPRRDIDRVEFVVGDSIITGIPIGTGEKVRGLRANYILTDEVASISEAVYSVVVQGFASVTADPIKNVLDSAYMQMLQRLGMWTADMDDDEAKRNRGNQSVLSGTASYSFNHFYKYWKDYKSIIESKGDIKKLEAHFGGPVPDNFKWKAHSIIRLPHDLIPRGFMDEQTIIRAQRTTNKGSFLMEYGATFLTDSDGFFRRSLIESCVVGKRDAEPIIFPSCGIANFSARLKGVEGKKYIYGVDPASESDNFALVILEHWGDHRRVVYTWTTNKAKQKTELKNGKVKTRNFYKYAVEKIRSLFKEFPPERILVDKGGGGLAMREAFSDEDKLNGDQPIYEVISEDPKEYKDTDGMQGLHLLEIVDFTTDWLIEANEGMKKDMEDRVLLFPIMDSLELGKAELQDEIDGNKMMNEDGEMVYVTSDTLEQNMIEIEKLKDELATIVITETPTGKRRWDTPDQKLPGSKIGRMRKDRYSALLLANMGTRIIARASEGLEYDGNVDGGFSAEIATYSEPVNRTGQLYKKGAPAWFSNKVNNFGGYGAVVLR